MFVHTAHALLYLLTLKWAHLAQVQPKKLWDDAGTGGRAGSMWVVNSMGLLHVCEGHRPPVETFFDLFERKFAADTHIAAMNFGNVMVKERAIEEAPTTPARHLGAADFMDAMVMTSHSSSLIVPSSYESYKFYSPGKYHLERLTLLILVDLRNLLYES
jgi:hypothetical protein